MFSIWGRNAKEENDQTALPIIRLIYLFLFLFSCSILYLSWSAYQSANYNLVLTYLTLFIIYLIAICFVLNDLHNRLKRYAEEGNIQRTEFIKNSHYLCANPMCKRCNGYYWSISIVLLVIVGFNSQIFTALKGVLPAYAYAIIGFVIFFISTPILGVWNFFVRYQGNGRVYSDGIKLILGVVSGLGIGLMSIGIIMLI